MDDSLGPLAYVNREISWLRFNHRVLEEALDQSQPLLERTKFISIFARNLDEYFMVRVSGLHRQARRPVTELAPDAMTAPQQLASIRDEIVEMLTRHSGCWHDDVRPALASNGLEVLDWTDLADADHAHLRDVFQSSLFPILTPLAVDSGHPFPHISNLSMNLAVEIQDPDGSKRFARLKIPGPRLIALPGVETRSDMAAGAPKHQDTPKRVYRFVWVEQIVAANLGSLFPGMKALSAHPFRVTRDADLVLPETTTSGLLETVEQSMRMRHFGNAMRLEIDTTMPCHLRSMLMRNLNLEDAQVYEINGPLDLGALWEICEVDLPHLKHKTFTPSDPRGPAGTNDLFAIIRERDVLVYHPYDSFMPVLDFVRTAARDPNVLAIKQTLYRVGRNSPIVAALEEARQNGKQVAVLVELQARFDEEINIQWALSLERVGAHVAYGFFGMKTHAKVCLVVRRESDSIRRYVHLSTGNYNPTTAAVYADIGLFTADPDIGADASDLFNMLTGYAEHLEYRKLLVAPQYLRRELASRVEREIQRHEEYGDGYLAFKMNSLIDVPFIELLYAASSAGVRIDLQVRGICCLRPGVPNLSDNIRVTSIVGRFLEHARIYYFHNGGDCEVLIGSADIRSRNLDRRVEVVFPISDPALRARIKKTILDTHLSDTVKTRLMLPDGTYQRLSPRPGGAILNSQEWLICNRGAWWKEA